MTRKPRPGSGHRQRIAVGPKHRRGDIPEAEASGILNWALAGLARLRARGFYDIPQSVKDAISRFKDDNNPIGEWVREAIAVDRYSKQSRGATLVRAYNAGWDVSSRMARRLWAEAVVG